VGTGEGYDAQADDHYVADRGRPVRYPECLHCCAHIAGDFDSASYGRVRQQESVFFASVPGGKVLASLDTTPDCSAHHLQAFIPRNVSQPIVVLFEIVDITDDQSNGTLISARR